MKTSKTDLIDSLFDGARVQPATPSDDLMARVLADAGVLQSKPEVHRVTQDSIFSQIVSMLGGWPALSGVAAAGVAGLWIGLAPPDAIDSWASEILGSTTTISFGDDFAVLEEGTFDG